MICIVFSWNGSPLPQNTYPLIGLSEWHFPIEARYVICGLSRSTMRCVAYCISFRCSLMYLAASLHASIISGFCRCRCWRFSCCSRLAISCCMASLFSYACSISSISFCVPHSSNRSVHSGSFGFGASLLSGYVFRPFFLVFHGSPTTPPILAAPLVGLQFPILALASDMPGWVSLDAGVVLWCHISVVSPDRPVSAGYISRRRRSRDALFAPDVAGSSSYLHAGRYCCALSSSYSCIWHCSRRSLFISLCFRPDLSMLACIFLCFPAPVFFCHIFLLFPFVLSCNCRLLPCRRRYHLVLSAYHA